MGEKQIYNQFKSRLGEYCSVCQFTELTTKCFNSNYSSILQNTYNFSSLCSENGVFLSSNDVGKAVTHMPQTYILIIHICFEEFLQKLYHELRKTSLNSFSEKKDGESYLECIYKNVRTKNRPETVDASFQLCEYYRLVRNYIVHQNINIRAVKAKYKTVSVLYDSISTKRYGKLHAPNLPQNLSFDDFIFFSKSCLEISAYLHKSLKLDNHKILRTASDETLYKWKNQTAERRRTSIQKYIQHYYRIDSSFQEDLPALEMFVAEFNSLKKASDK